MDKLTPKQRSINMSKIKGKDTSIEVQVRKYLHNKGYRFRKNDKRYPGKPDIVLPKYNTVIFINGCFWHQHENCKLAVIPKTNTEFWTNKFRRTKEKDQENLNELKQMGWKTITLWECELENNFEKTLDNLIKFLNNTVETTEI